MELLNNMISLFVKGGLVMYPLVGCSILVIAIAIDRYIYFRAAETNVAGLLASIDSKLECADWSVAAKTCATAQGATAAILAKGLSLLPNNRLRLEHTLENAATLTAAKLQTRLNYLDTIVTLAPLLGLLGTVIGMINSFSVFTLKAGQPLAITGGVGEALVATAAGLCVAIMALVAHSYFTNRLDTIITDMEQAANHLLTAVERSDFYEIS